jgi:hypothetical protein
MWVLPFRAKTTLGEREVRIFNEGENYHKKLAIHGAILYV